METKTIDTDLLNTMKVADQAIRQFCEAEGNPYELICDARDTLQHEILKHEPDYEKWEGPEFPEIWKFDTGYRKPRKMKHGNYPVWGLDGDGNIYEQWAPGETVPDIVIDDCLFIPENKHDVWAGYWQDGAKVTLLREVSHQPEVIQFIADMME